MFPPHPTSGSVKIICSSCGVGAFKDVDKVVASPLFCGWQPWEGKTVWPESDSLTPPLEHLQPNLFLTNKLNLNKLSLGNAIFCLFYVGISCFPISVFSQPFWEHMNDDICIGTRGRLYEYRNSIGNNSQNRLLDYIISFFRWWYFVCWWVGFIINNRRGRIPKASRSLGKKTTFPVHDRSDMAFHQ